MKTNHSSDTSKKHARDWSGNTKQMADEKVGAPGKLGRAGNVRVSPYVRLTAKRGSKNTVSAVVPSIWLVTIAMPLWRAGQIDPGTAESIKACVMGVIISIIAVPWPYFMAAYVKAPMDRWKSSTLNT